MKRIVGYAAAVALGASFGVASHAATITLTSLPVATYNSTTGAVISSNNNGVDVSSNPGAPEYVKVNVYATFASTAPGQDYFGASSFDINPGSGVSFPAANLGAVKKAWQINNPNWTESAANPDFNDPPVAYPTYNPTFSGDTATAGDFKGITNIIDPQKPDYGRGVDPNDPAPLIGQSTPTNNSLNLLGSYYILWNGTDQASISYTDQGTDYFNKTTQLLVTQPKGLGNLVAPALVLGGSAGTTPEPASLSLLALGGVMAIRRRRA